MEGGEMKVGKPQEKERKWGEKGEGYKWGKPIKRGERWRRKWKAYKEGKWKGTSERMWPWAPSLNFNPSLYEWGVMYKVEQ